MCIMDYDTLQYCDFLGSICSIWVTILCMARIGDLFKYVRHWLLPASLYVILTLYWGLKCCSSSIYLSIYFFSLLCVFVDFVHARGSADSHVNAAGSQRPVEPVGPHPLFHTSHGCFLGKRWTTFLQAVTQARKVQVILKIDLLLLTFGVSCSLLFTGVPRGAATTLLPTFMETMGPLPNPRGALRSDRRVFVHFRRDRGQLLLHAFAVAHPGGHLRGVPAATEGEEQGGVWLDQGMELELATSCMWIYTLSK